MALAFVKKDGWLRCPNCGWVVEADVWIVRGAYGGTLYCNNCDARVVPIPVDPAFEEERPC